MEQNFNLLAETLARSGLACSPNEAVRMAKSIMGTEAAVKKEFEEGTERIVGSMPKRRTYQEEIDYLIEKTDFQKKDFHVPISGYRKQASVAPAIKVQEQPKEQVFFELEPVKEEPEPVAVAKEVEAPKIAPGPLEVYSNVEDNRPLSEVLRAPEKEFIVDVPQEDKSREVFEKPVARIPIPKVDLMNHFKFG